MKQKLFQKLILITSILIFVSCGTNQQAAETKKTTVESPQEGLENKENNGMQKILLKKIAEGIDFYATGNEPFWTFDMDFDKSIRFKTMNGIDFRTPPTKPEKTQDPNITIYKAITESGEINIQLIHQKCVDNMSGAEFSYQVKVQYKTTLDSEYKTFEGCGQYVPDFRLHNIWLIKEVDGITIKPNTFKNKQPILELNLTKNTLFGNNGCNMFNGPIEVQNNKIIFGMYATTMMACPDNHEITTKIMQCIDRTTLDYKFEKNLLILSKNGIVKMALQNID